MAVLISKYAIKKMHRYFIVAYAEDEDLWLDFMPTNPSARLHEVSCSAMSPRIGEGGVCPDLV